MEILKIMPCPFCESTDQTVLKFSNRKAVNCGYCDAIGPEGDNKKQAIKNWNKAWSEK